MALLLYLSLSESGTAVPDFFIIGDVYMGITELILIAVGLAMDAFSVSVCKGLSMKKIDRKGAFVTALFFGVFQAAMPMIGYLLGSRFAEYISHFSHWISFILLGFIGGKMIVEVLRCKEEEKKGGEYRLDLRELVLLAVATSIDALAVGIIFAADKTNILYSASVIGVITFVICLFGVMIGNRFGSKYEQKAQLAGGGVLVIIGAKLLLDGLGVFG